MERGGGEKNAAVTSMMLLEFESILAVCGTATTFRSAAAIFVENGAIKMTLKERDH